MMTNDNSSTSYPLSSIARFLSHSAPLGSNANRNIKVLLTDSRSLTYPEQSLFFAINTSTNDGHRYISDLYEKGVRAFVVSHLPDNVASMPDASFIVVNNVTRALQTITTAHRQRFNIPVIGITGSRGKTTVKEWLYQLLAVDYNVERSPRSYNSQIGVPLSVWGIDDSTTLAIFEAGISKIGEMSSIANVIQPSIGIITNIGSPHDDGFISPAQKCDEKLMLFDECEVVIYNADDNLIATRVDLHFSQHKRLGWSIKQPEAPLYISSVNTNLAEASTSLCYTFHHMYNHKDVSAQITIPFTTKSAVENAIACLATMLWLGIEADVIEQRMALLTAVGTRLEVIEGVNDCLVIHDSYTSDLHSLEPALDFMYRRRTAMRTTTLILSDLMHDTMDAESLYHAVARLLRRKSVDRLIGIGPEISSFASLFGSEAVFYPSTQIFLQQVSPSDFDHELILVKGAPAFHFDSVTDMLEARLHETVLEVSLDAMISNFNYFKAMLHPSTGIVCMVKASGYGAGALELSKSLQSQGAAYVAVAVVDEGVELRNAGVTMPIMVMNPKVVNYRALFHNNLEPEIYSFSILNEIIREGTKYGVTDFPVHLKLDTGMHRLGFVESELPQVIDIIRNQRVIRVASVFSHLAGADDPALDYYTQMQFDVFDRCADLLRSQLPYPIKRHILNSAGIARFPGHQYELVRLGIGLYGVDTIGGGLLSGLRQVSSLHTVVISVRHWPAGASIGYSRKGILKRDSIIATIPVGYADGIDRRLGNGAMSVVIRGMRCPTIGNICMDACMIDVTDCPECTENDRVEIFGDSVPVSELADTLHTIPYEILTSVSERVKRVYYRD